MAKYKTNKLIEQVNNIASTVRTTFDSQGNYKGLSHDTACKIGLFPEYMKKDCTCGQHGNSCIVSVYGSEIGLSGSNYEGSSENSFKITVRVPTKEACMALYSVDWGGATGFLGFARLSNHTLMSKNMIEVVAEVISNGYCSDRGGQILLVFR